MDLLVITVLALVLILHPKCSMSYRDEQVDGYFVARDSVKSDPVNSNIEDVNVENLNFLPASRQVRT